MTRLVLLLLCLILPTLAPAQSDVSEIRLLPGWRTESGTHMAAIELRLAPGWKTYWRRPGEAGIPPSLNWSGSSNIAGAQVHWPTPDVFWQAGMRSVGYADGLILPVELLPQRAGEPITVRLSMEFGVCLDICVPVSQQVAARLDATMTQSDPRIRSALSNRPLSEREAGVARADCALVPTARGARLTARIEMPGMGGTEEVVFEPADAGLWVSEPVTRREGNVLIAEAEIEPPRGMPLMIDRAGLRTTVIGARGAVDIRGCD